MTELQRNNSSQKIIDFMKQKLSRESIWEYCVICGQRTDTKRDEPVIRRPHYIEGVGQLCPGCYRQNST